MRNFFVSLLVASTLPLQAGLKGKVDIGPAYVHLETIVDNRTFSKTDLGAIKFDGNVYNDQGWGSKLSVLQSVWDMDSTGEDATTIQLAVGRYIPVTSCLTLFPEVGIGWSSITTDLELATMIPLKRVSKSPGYFIGFEGCYSITKCFRFCGQFLWGWTKIKSEFKTKESNQLVNTVHSTGSGPVLSALLEYDLNNRWSVNIGGAYNLSWDDDNNGLRAWGGKAGIAYWF